MWTKEFWKDTIERAIKTTAQFIIALSGYSGVAGDFSCIDWQFVLVNSAIGGLLSVAFSIASSLKNKTDSASLIK